MRTTTFPFTEMMTASARDFFGHRLKEIVGLVVLASTLGLGIALATWSISDPSLNHATDTPVKNLLGVNGAIVADLIMQMFGVSSIVLLAPLGLFGWRVLSHCQQKGMARRLAHWILGAVCAAAVASILPPTDGWPLPTGLGGVIGDALVATPKRYCSPFGLTLCGLIYFAVAALALASSLLAQSSTSRDCEVHGNDAVARVTSAEGNMEADGPSEKDRWFSLLSSKIFRNIFRIPAPAEGAEISTRACGATHQSPAQSAASHSLLSLEQIASDWSSIRINSATTPLSTKRAAPALLLKSEVQQRHHVTKPYTAPPESLLAAEKKIGTTISRDSLEQNARLLEGVLEDFSVKGDIVSVFPGPVVTLYEFEPAPGIKSSRVIGLADDIARSMSAISARVAVVPGRNAIGIELPNPRRETVYLRELIASPDFVETKHKLAIALGKTIGGEPVIVDLARMPHLLVAGTTGSGKSVAINTMILSLLYKHKPQDCRLIMVDPKMLELSVYDGVPHLLTPVVTDPKKAVVALKWAVREMEDRYKKMSKLGVRNIDGFNARVTEAAAKGEIICRTVQTGFDRETGEAIYEQERMDLSVLPYIVVIVDEMADLMMVAGKEIEGAIQRLAQMARAAGIHLIMATQRPSVDVITGTIKANFPTRISFQVTSKIDSRTILGEMGAEQLLGQGDMLYMAGGGRISRVHGPFVSDADVEKVVAHLKMQGQPEYLDAVTVEDEPENEEDEAPAYAGEDEGADLYDRAVAIVLRDKKCSTSYVQRRLSVGYNKAASLVERMEKEGVVGPANHAGKRAILVGGGVDRGAFDGED